MPVLQLLFTLYRQFHRSEHFEPDKHVRIPAFGESFNQSKSVLREALGKIRRHADLHVAAFAAGEDVDARLEISHCTVCLLSRNKFGMTKFFCDLFSAVILNSFQDNKPTLTFSARSPHSRRWSRPRRQQMARHYPLLHAVRDRPVLRRREIAARSRPMDRQMQ